ncbi:TorF family putative porin [Pseudomonas sp. RIT-To-2]|uniref:TorF family putative porin n=1 Tax=Pseudomonas sp. RIT-To-2 TaxID=3462541 RepID=UPI0024137141
MTSVRSVAMGALLACTIVQAHAFDLGNGYSVLADATVGSDYRIKGISQTSNKPGAQALAVLSSPYGLYAGAYLANVEFKGSNASYEYDYLAGAMIPLVMGFMANVGYIDINYSGAKYYNFNGWYGELIGYGAKIGFQYAPASMSSFHQSSMYSYAEYSHSLLLEFVGKLHFGYVDYKDDVFWDRDMHARQGYREWEVKVSRNLVGVEFGVSYVDNDLTKFECASYSGDGSVCSSAFIFTAKKKF